MGAVGRVNNSNTMEMKKNNIVVGDTLVFQGGKEGAINKIEKVGKKYTTFRAGSYNIKYRVNHENGEVQVSPYWNVVKNMYIKK